MDVHSLSIPLPKSILLFIQFGVIINKATLNIDMHVYVRTYVFKVVDKGDTFLQRYFMIMKTSIEAY